MTDSDWTASLNAVDRERADRLVALLGRLGAADPAGWVRPDVSGGGPDVARFLFLHEVRQRVTDLLGAYAGEGAPPGPAWEEVEAEGADAYDRLLEAGADPSDLARFAQGTIAEATFAFVSMLDRAPEPLGGLEGAPGWALAETAGPEGERRLTGRCLGGLHEDLGALYATDV